MIPVSSFRLLLLLPLIFLSTANASASPRVLVSVPELYSLVSDLMKGAGAPKLLIHDSAHMDGELSPHQVRSVIWADMIVWAGPGLETPLKEALEDTVPAAATNLVTLSNYVPLLSKSGNALAAPSGRHDRQTTMDLRFWSDPRLAIKAVRYLTPRLVRLDPEHQELYLDNEIDLVRRLKQLEGDITAMFMPFGVLSAAIFPPSDPYFAHRFGINSLALRDNPLVRSSLAGNYCTDSSVQKVLLRNDQHQMVQGGSVSGRNSGKTDLSLYFRSMRGKARAALDALCVHPSGMSVGPAGDATANGI